MPVIYLDRRVVQPPSPKNSTSYLAEINATVDSSRENLNSDEFDVTWGGKRQRYVYNCAVQSDSSTDSYSDCTESILSIQSKTTMTLQSEDDEHLSDSDCDCQNRPNPEYEVVSSDSSFHVDDSDNSSDSAVLYNHNLPEKMIVNDFSEHSDDTGYFPENVDKTDDQKVCQNGASKKQPPPACFKNCAQCRKLNPNPYFQYCLTCFRHRKEFFVCKPKPRVKRLKASGHTKSSKSLTDFGKPGPSNSHQSSSVSTDNKLLSHNEIDKTKKVEMYKHVCKICFVKPLDGIFNHGKISHIYSCYVCSKELFKKTKKCPICGLKVKCVTKMIVV